MKTEKIIGYFLLSLGLFFILLSVLSVYKVFSGAMEPPSIFNVGNLTLKIPAQPGGTVTSVELASSELASKFFNMFSWYIVMLFLLSSGSKIAGIATNLIKDSKSAAKQPVS